MSPPTFIKGFAHGFMKLDVTTDASPNVQFKSSAKHDLTAQTLAGNVEVKYKIPEHGITITEKWNTNNQLTTVFEVKDKNGKRVGAANADWYNESVHINSSLTLFDGPVFTASAVAQIPRDWPTAGWLAGGQAKIDFSTGELKTTSFALGRKMADWTLHSFIVDGKQFGGSVHHRVHKNLEYGVMLGWKSGDADAQWGIASKYIVNPELSVRAKLDNKSQVSVSATHSLSDALKLTLSSHFGLTNFPDAVSKIGLGLEYCPSPCCNGM
uniref:Voltage-dependent anion-selective channel n=1 Tax=Globodera rostochiensis TaxID=31243 RepID=A0A914H8W9_GLORO